MRSAILAIVSGFAMTISASAIAAESGTAMQPQNVSATDGSSKLVCHHLVHEGMIFKAMSCRTQRQVDGERSSDQKILSDFQTRSLLFK